MMKMKIFASLSEHINEGFVWLRRNNSPKRGIVEIKNLESGKSIFCEALDMGNNFLRKYEQPPRFKIQNPDQSIVMNEWYRDRLGDLKTQNDYTIRIMDANSWYGWIRACLDHPQVVVRVAAQLGILGSLLGVVGFLLSFINILA